MEQSPIWAALSARKRPRTQFKRKHEHCSARNIMYGDAGGNNAFDQLEKTSLHCQPIQEADRSTARQWLKDSIKRRVLKLLPEDEGGKTPGRSWSIGLRPYWIPFLDHQSPHRPN